MAWLFLRGKDLESEAGLELLALCQGVTLDGKIVDEEISALRDWLARTDTAAFPGAERLRKLVTNVLADGRITPEERKAVHAAVEAILPPEYRQDAIAKRKELQAAERVRLREEREAAKEEERRSRAVWAFDAMVAGVAYHGRASTIRDSVREGDPAYLLRDRANAHSRNAVKVLNRLGQEIGFVPEDEAVDVAPLLDSGHRHRAFVKKVLTRGRYPIPVVVGELFVPDAPVAGLIADSEVRALASAAPATQSMWLARTVLAIIGLGLLAILMSLFR